MTNSERPSHAFGPCANHRPLIAGVETFIYKKKPCENRKALQLAPAVGFEPTTNRLTADCSTAELSRNNMLWRPVPESNRYRRICSPLHNHSANRPQYRRTFNGNYIYKFFCRRQ